MPVSIGGSGFITGLDQGIDGVGIITATSFSGPLTGNVTGDLTSSGVSTVGQLNVGTGGTIITTTSGGLVGIGTTNPVKTIDVRGEATFGAGITISDLSWAKDTNQLVYSFSGTASGTNPADGVIALVNPNANPSNTRIGSLLYGNKVSGTTATSNPGIKAVIDVYTNTNVANAADTGAYMNFYTKPDNANNRVQMILNSNGVLTKPYQPAFLAYNSSGVSVSGGWFNLSSSITTEAYDIGGDYGTSTAGRFVAPVAGRYLFYAGGWSTGNTADARYAISATVNGGSQFYISGGNYSLVDSPLSGYFIIHNLAVNDFVELFYFSAIATQWGGGSHPIYWGGYLLG